MMAKKAPTVYHVNPCVQEKRLQTIERDIKSITMGVTGINTALNGTNGLMAIVMTQVQVSETQGENIDKLMTMVDVLRVKDIETDTEKEVKGRIYRRNRELEREKEELLKEIRKERKIQLRWIIGIIFTALSLTVAAVALYIKYKG